MNPVENESARASDENKVTFDAWRREWLPEAGTYLTKAELKAKKNRERDVAKAVIRYFVTDFITSWGYRNTRHSLREQFPNDRGKAFNELAATIILRLLVFNNEYTNKPKMPSLILDGPVRSGTSTQAELWKEYFDFESLQMGMMFRAIAFVAMKNNLTADQVIALTKAGKIHFAIRFQDDQPVFEVACTHPDHQFLQTIQQSEFESLRTPEINKFSSALNNDAERSVEALVVKIVDEYLERTAGVVMEGRNLASIIPSFSIRAFYLAVSDEEAVRREAASINAKRKREGKPSLTDQEVAEIRQSVIARNQSDSDNGILLNPKQAYDSQKYTAIYKTDMAGPMRLFLSMMLIHDLIQIDDLFIPSKMASLQLHTFSGYNEDPLKSLMTFSRRKDRPVGNRALA